MLDKIKNEAAGLLVLRLAVGGLMLFHGVAKILNPASLNFIGGALGGLGLPTFLSYGVYIGEVLGPLLIIIGLKSRIGGLLVVANMLFVLGLAHRGDFLGLSPYGGWAVELQVFFLLGALVVALLGSGRFAVKPD